MLVTCPSCQSSYRFSDEAIGEGRMVRCARCTTQWFAGPPPEPIMALDDAAPVEAFDEEPAAQTVDDQASTETRRKTSRARKQSGARRWPPIKPKFALVLLGLAALALLLIQRVEVVKLAPSLSSLYGALGLDVNIRGLDLREVRSAEQLEEGSPLLLVTGAIANVTKNAVAVPRLRLAVMADDDRELYAWTTVAARGELGPGEIAQFRARLASPPAEGQRVAVRFLNRRDIMTRPGF
ncbi:zinc-ribbon domain-containing protein [Hansschlegelia quercus]|uniref:Zinc finger/thioredoxin putative domain-containing protein n=1 Tax=Hansschlegelia quercus TaxID=2528245 RepID=A0A4Q9GLD3_9HYPH|nr:zinc-ribbon domain-containing protein [Hansschlegelia quercus]TBN53875.1 hypothetical protein EYR15_08780 [Hansschlegelia quercus]